MNAIRIFTRSEKDGELLLQNLPVKKGQAVEVIVLTEGIADEVDEVLFNTLVGRLVRLLQRGTLGKEHQEEK